MHSLFEKMHPSAEEDSVVHAGRLCEVEEVLNTRVFVDLLKDLGGKCVDRHFCVCFSIFSLLCILPMFCVCKWS